MRISYQWLKDFIPDLPSPDEVSKLLTSCGLEVESYDYYESIKGSLKGLVVGKILSCDRHPNADKLKLTIVHIGASVLKIVCGANNVAKDQLVIVALNGTKLYPIKGEPITIQTSKIRGEISEGMICAEDEIGLGDSHEGIIVLDSDYAIGTPAADVFGIYEDYIFEIGLTPNRGDAASHLGVAYDLAVMLGRRLEIPNFKNLPQVSELLPLEIKIENTDWCTRYSALILSDIKVQPSSTFVSNRLKAIGVTPINNVVDVTNYILHGYGQPMHAFDYDTIKSKKVCIGKSSLHKSTIKTLDGVERAIDGDDLLIKDDANPMCFAGVFGGEQSGVSDSSTNILFESACFNPTEVRKTSQRHSLKTDASFRFERGTDVDFTLKALQAAFHMLYEFNNGVKVSNLIDMYPSPLRSREIQVNLERIDQLLGVEIPQDQALKILNDLHLEKLHQSGNVLSIQIPNRRNDLYHEADIAEELLRMYGFDKVPLSDHNGTRYISEFPKNTASEIVKKCTEVLISQGFFEVMTNSLISESEALHSSTMMEGVPVSLLNPLSEEMNFLRNSILPSLLATAAYNLNRKQKNLKLFEWGKAYSKSNNNYEEKNYLSIILTGQIYDESWQHKEENVDYFSLFNIITSLFERVGIKDVIIKRGTSEDFEPSISLFYKDKSLATIGKVKRQLLKRYDIRQDIWYASIPISSLVSLDQKPITIKEPEKHPVVRRDLSLIVNENVLYADIVEVSKNTEKYLLKDINLFDTFSGTQLGAGKKSYSVSYTIAHEGKTLEENEIEATMEKLINALKNSLGVYIRK